jgi:very-short-patch-repair endonuclease
MDGVFHRSELGWSSRRIATEIARGAIIRVRNGWYATQDANEAVVRAVRVGGRLTCVSLARELGLWTVPDLRLHVAMAANASRSRRPEARAPLDRSRTDVVRHWGDPVRPAEATASRDDTANALAHLIRCQPARSTVITLDSALNTGVIGLADLGRIFATVPRRFRHLQSRLDGASQSGLETMCRLALVSRGLRVRTQVPIAGVGAVDVLVGDRLVIELDGNEFHSGPREFANDRRRDLELARLGYRVIRLSFSQVMTDWDACEAVILRLVRAGEHRWRPSALKHFA